jgi:hypothetical protein
VILVSLAISLSFDIFVYFWAKKSTLSVFHASEIVHKIQYFINDHLPINLLTALDRPLQKQFNQAIETYDLDFLIAFTFENWIYRSDSYLWDVADLPVVAFANMSGDCDDYARLAAYMMHIKGYKQAYFVTMAGTDKKNGHAVSIYYNPEKKMTYLIDVNGQWEMSDDAFSTASIRQMIHRCYSNMLFYCVYSWDTTKMLEIGRIN